MVRPFRRTLFIAPVRIQVDCFSQIDFFVKRRNVEEAILLGEVPHEDGDGREDTKDIQLLQA